MKQPLIILRGPTASGKTALSVALAKRILNMFYIIKFCFRDTGTLS